MSVDLKRAEEMVEKEAPAATDEEAPEILRTLAAWRGSAEEVAADEAFWALVRRLFPTDRTMLNLNNGGVSPAPVSVLAAMKRHLDHANLAPALILWEVLEPRREEVRGRLARVFGCDPEEVALMRNASEALETCQLGLDLRPGDEVLTTTVDYDRMLTAWGQRTRRDGIAIRTFPLPLPRGRSGEGGAHDDEIVELFARHITGRTRVIHLSHAVYLTGQILPVRRIVELARRHGIAAFVDGAHAFAHLDFSHADVGCDYYAASLHKWLNGPHGTGMLYVRRDAIPALWPLMAAPESMAGDIRKFEEIGTHPEAPYLAVLEALDLHEAIGASRKAARLRYLRDRWARRLLADRRVSLLTSLEPGAACGFATFRIEGRDPEDLVERLWDRHRIFVNPITHPEFTGVRVTPSFYTTAAEIDFFAAAVEGELAGPIPSKL